VDRWVACGRELCGLVVLGMAALWTDDSLWMGTKVAKAVDFLYFYHEKLLGVDGAVV